MTRTSYSPETVLTELNSKVSDLEPILEKSTSSDEQLKKLDDIINLLGTITSLLAIPDINARNRVNIEAGTLPTVTTVTTVTTVSTVTTATTLTNLVNFGNLTTGISNPILFSYYIGQICELLENGLTVETMGFDGTNFKKVLTDTLGQLQVTLGTKIAGEDLTNNIMVVEERYSYTNVATAATTVIKSGAGFLHAIVVNTPLATGTLTIYDNTAGSGTKIATITYPATLLSTGPNTIIYDCSFGTGLTIVGATANVDYTAIWR